MDDVKIEIGYALPKERWNEAAENLMKAGLMAAKYLRAMNFEGRGKEDADNGWLMSPSLVLPCGMLRSLLRISAV